MKENSYTWKIALIRIDGTVKCVYHTATVKEIQMYAREKFDEMKKSDFGFCDYEVTKVGEDQDVNN